MRILLIENDAPCAAAFELMLKSEGFNVYTTDEGAEGIELATLYDYDAVVLSSTPEHSDIAMVLAIRREKVKAAIIVLTSTPTIEHTIRTLGTGADDVIARPFHSDELIARILATVRRSKGHTQSLITIGDLVINIESKGVTMYGDAVHLTGKEFAMLELLALRKNNVLTKEVILNSLYGGMDEPELKIIDVFICKLRKKLPPGIIETVWGRGYVLRDDTVPKVGLPPVVHNPVGPMTEYVRSTAFAT